MLGSVNMTGTDTDETQSVAASNTKRKDMQRATVPEKRALVQLTPLLDPPINDPTTTIIGTNK